MKIVLLFLLCLISSNVICQSGEYARTFSYYTSLKNFNGAVLVAKKGHIEFSGGAGIGVRQTNTAINLKSKFKIASITKTFTAVLLMQLHEQGKINLDSTIGHYLPGYKGNGKNMVSLYQLLTYSSGIPNCENNLDMQVYQLPLSVDDFIDKYCSGDLEAVPGTKFNYDNGDYIILGRIIERVTGISFGKLLSDKILSPLGMNNTAMLSYKDIVPGLVSSYIYNDSTKSFSSDPPYFIDNFFSSAAMYSTVEDLLKFDEGIFRYKLLKRESVELMIKPNEALGNVGLGFWFASGYGAISVPYVYRPGGIQGSLANWIHVLGSNITIIAFANTDATNLFEMSQQLYKVAIGGKMDAPVKKPSGK